MLAVLFNLGDQRRGLAVSLVERVVPAPPGRSASGAPAPFEIISYHGQDVPLVDLALLAGGLPSRPHLGTRVILVRHPDPPRLLGLLAERVTEVLHLSAPGPGEPVPGEARLVTIQELLPPELLAQLPGAASPAATSP
jgi:chemotaxis-related protein WspB